MMNKTNSSRQITMIQHDELPCGPERIPFRVIMALFAMVTMNKCHTSVHDGANGNFASGYLHNSNCNSRRVITKNS